MSVKQQFCKFHTKKVLNKQINDTIKKIKPEIKEINEINYFKKLIFDLLDSNTLKEDKKIRKTLFSLKNQFPLIISKIFFDFLISYFKNLTYYLENSKIEYTTNKIENSFQKIFPKHIKKIYRTKKGILTRFNLRLSNWNEENQAM